MLKIKARVTVMKNHFERLNTTFKTIKRRINNFEYFPTEITQIETKMEIKKKRARQSVRPHQMI